MNDSEMDFAPEIADAVSEIRKSWSGREHVRRRYARPKPIRSVADFRKIAVYLEKQRLARLVALPLPPEIPVVIKPRKFAPIDNDTPTSAIKLRKERQLRREKGFAMGVGAGCRPENVALVGQFIQDTLSAIYASL